MLAKTIVRTLILISANTCIQNTIKDKKLFINIYDKVFTKKKKK